MNKILFAISLVGIFALTSCKTEYEKVRTSGDPDRIYKKALEYYEEEDYLKAQTLMEAALPFFRGRAEAEDLYFKTAYTYYRLKDYLLAAHYFENFGRTFLNSKYREEADFMAANSYYRSSPSYMLDQAYTKKAIEYFQIFANRYPQSKRIGEVNRLIDLLRGKLEKKAFYDAKLYYDMEDYLAANTAFKDILVSFPDIDNVEEVRYLLVKSHYNLAINSVYSKQDERMKGALEEGVKFLKRYPKTKYRKEVKSYIKTLKSKLKS